MGFIALQTAIDMTTDFRADRETILANAYKNQNILCIAETFDKSDFEALLATPDCYYIRIYYSMDSYKKVHAIIVAVNERNEDILPQENETEPSAYIVEQGMRCPEDCPEESPLNPS